MAKRALSLFLTLLLILSLAGCTKSEDEQKQIMKATIAHIHEIHYNMLDNVNMMFRVYDTKDKNPKALSDMGYVKTSFKNYKNQIDSIKIDDGLSGPRKETLKRVKGNYSTCLENLIIVSGGLQEFIKNGAPDEPSDKLRDATFTVDEKLKTIFATIKPLGEEYGVKITSPELYNPKNTVFNNKK